MLKMVAALIVLFVGVPVLAEQRFEIKDFYSGMTVESLRDFASGVEGATFLGEGEYAQPLLAFGLENRSRVPENNAIVDFNFCGLEPGSAKYNDSLLATAKKFAEKGLYDRCIEEYGVGANYTIAGLPIDRIYLKTKRYEGRSTPAGKTYEQCLEMQIFSEGMTYAEHSAVSKKILSILEDRYGLHSRSESGSLIFIDWSKWIPSPDNYYEGNLHKLTFVHHARASNYDQPQDIRFEMSSCVEEFEASSVKFDESDI